MLACPELLICLPSLRSDTLCGHALDQAYRYEGLPIAPALRPRFLWIEALTENLVLALSVSSVAAIVHCLASQLPRSDSRMNLCLDFSGCQLTSLQHFFLWSFQGLRRSPSF